MTDTPSSSRLSEVPTAPREREVPPPTMAQRQLADAIAEAFSPVRVVWDARSQDMLDVLADSAAARAQIEKAVRTIRVAAWLGVLAMVLGAVGVWVSLENGRDEARKFRASEQAQRATTADDIVRRVEASCRH